MAVKVLELELSQDFPDFSNLPKKYEKLQILVREQGQPIGYTYIDLIGKSSLSVQDIKEEIAKQLSKDLKRVELDKLFGAPTLPEELPFITLAICTRDRPEQLERALNSLDYLDYPLEKLEILVIDNAPSSPSTKLVTAKFNRIRYLLEPRPGLDWARNRAIMEAKGDIIAYTDDDVRVDPLWLKAMVPHFVNPAVMCVTGLVAPAELETEAQILFEQYNGFGRGFELEYYTIGLQKYDRRFPLGAGKFGTGANMAFRKNLFQKIGSFDEALDVGTPTCGAGDLDMFYRVLTAGYILVYEPDAMIWHYHRADFSQLKKQINDWGRSGFAFWTKIFLSDPSMRWRTCYISLWYLKFLVRNALKYRDALQWLVVTQIVGSFRGPFAYFKSQKHREHILQQFGNLRSYYPTPSSIQTVTTTLHVSDDISEKNN